MCYKRECKMESVAQQILLSTEFVQNYIEETVTLKIWHSPYLLFFALYGTFFVLALFILSYPEYFAYTMFDEWDSYDRLFERADRVLQGVGTQQDLEELLEEKPRHLPLLHRRWLQEAQRRFGPKLHALLTEYEECGTNIQRVCLNETATDLRKLRGNATRLSDLSEDDNASRYSDDYA
uniref:PHM7_cyt domain-containing protein n=1 Tax=Macrostomum lignano TaxID=282301 RepID=A0A1I8JHL2_9PLAT